MILNILNQKDLKIISFFWKIKDESIKPTTWELTRKMYGEVNSNNHMKIKNHMEKLSNYGIIRIFERNGMTPRYELDTTRVTLKKITYPERQSESVCFKIDEKWYSIEV